MIRKPSVAGYFYPENPEDLRKMIEKMVDVHEKKKKAFCVVSPHAGYVYSGAVAGAVFSSVDIPDKLIILGPNHHNVQTKFAIMKEGIWHTPIGDVPVENRLAKLIMKNTSLVVEDNRAHLKEHSLEVQLPFIQYLKKSLSIVPIIIAFYSSFEELEGLGKSIAKSIRDFKENVMIVASTDMSHYIDQATAKKKDFLAIDNILKLDAKGLYDIVQLENITMCGYQPTVAAIVASKELGATRATLLKYQTSGDVTGNYLEVVGYAGIRIE